jgi:hypothetical protein
MTQQTVLAAGGGGDVGAQLVQVAGALLILAAYAGAQLGRMNQHGVVYLVLNVIGSAVLAVLATIDLQYGFILLEAVWAIVSLYGLVQVLRGRTPAAAH